jgi:hypothetical protein
MNLFLYSRLAGSNFWGSIDRHQKQGGHDTWRRSSKRIGGYWLGSFSVTEMTPGAMAHFYDQWLGMKLVEKTLGITSWEASLPGRALSTRCGWW